MSQKENQDSSLRRGINHITEMFYQPFSTGALDQLPARGQGMRAKSKRADRIPDEYVPFVASQLIPSPQRPLVTDYHSINDTTIRLRVPSK